MNRDIPLMLPVGKTCMDCQHEPYCSKYGVDTAERVICVNGGRFTPVDVKESAATAER